MRKSSTILIISLLVFSVFATMSNMSLVTAQAAEDAYTHVTWNVINETTTESHEAQNSQWIFGPQPEIWVGYKNNLTSIADNHFTVNVGTGLYVNITVPKSFMGEGNTLDTLRFWGTTHRPRTPIFVLEYNATADDWNYISVYYQPGSQEPSTGHFLELNVSESTYIETDSEYKVIFSITFIEAVVEDVFWTGMQAIDQEGRPSSPSWLARLQSGSFVSPPIALGTVVNPRDFQLPNYYYAEITDVNGEILHFAGVNDTFVMRILASKPLSEVLIPFTIVDWATNLLQWVNYTQPVGWPETMFEKDVQMETVSIRHPPTLFFQFNETGVHVVLGYPDIKYEWTEIQDDIGIWFPNFGITYNSSLDLSKYFIANGTFTGASNGNTTIEWAGYFTNNTDMNADPFKIGNVISPEMALVKVVAEDGERLQVRPEVAEKQTVRLAYLADFIEAFVFNENGEIAEIAKQGETLNMTLQVHKPIQEVNGSTVIYHSGLAFNITNELSTFSIEVKGRGGGSNETHFWQSEVIYNMTLFFENMTSQTYTTLITKTFLRGGELVDETVVTTNLWNVIDFSIDTEENLIVLKILFNFSLNAPSMVLNEAHISVGYIQNIRIWNGSDWVLPSWLQPEEYEDWIDHYIVRDISGDALWSPYNMRLGEVDFWRPPLWTVTADGAIDLDGNTYTTDDQYFVKRTGFWSDNVTINTEGMIVGVGFDPSPAVPGDEFVSWSWMGVRDLFLEFEAHEEFYWYHASDMSLVNSTEMDEIRATMWANVTQGMPVPGYEWVAWLTENRTLDLTGITGLDSNEWHTTWFAWGTQQAFLVSIDENTTMAATFRARYAGMLLFNDDPTNPAEGAPDFEIVDGKIVTDEVTHIVLIDSIDSLELRRPFGATNDTGDVIVDPSTEVSFGITIRDVNVTIYPIKVEHSDGLRGPWAFRESYEGALGLNSTNFDYWITHATIDEMSFDITFNVDMVEYDPLDPTKWNHAVSFKIDQRIGDWTLLDFNQTALEGRGLAVNFFGILGTVTRTEYRAGEKPVTDTNGDSESANYYEFGAENSPFANVSMGGLPYTWGGDGHSTVYTSGSSTAPIGAFSLFYESNSGNTVTDWTVDASMLFMTAGYTNWGGEDIICDPVFVSYTSAQYTPTEEPFTTTNIRSMYLIVGGAVALLVIVLVFARRRK